MSEPIYLSMDNSTSYNPLNNIAGLTKGATLEWLFVFCGLFLTVTCGLVIYYDVSRPSWKGHYKVTAWRCVFCLIYVLLILVVGMFWSLPAHVRAYPTQPGWHLAFSAMLTTLIFVLGVLHVEGILP